jgi:predicted nucleic acid-binding protein
MQQGNVVDMDSAVTLYAAGIGVDLKLPLPDSVILATARMHNATIWTQDDDFKELEGVRYVSKK